MTARGSIYQSDEVKNGFTVMYVFKLPTCHPGKHCKTTKVGEETQGGADDLWEMVGRMEDDEEGDVEEDDADQVHADDVAMEGVEHGQD